MSNEQITAHEKTRQLQINPKAALALALFFGTLALTTACGDDNKGKLSDLRTSGDTDPRDNCGANTFYSTKTNNCEFPQRLSCSGGLNSSTCEALVGPDDNGLYPIHSCADTVGVDFCSQVDCQTDDDCKDFFAATDNTSGYKCDDFCVAPGGERK